MLVHFMFVLTCQWLCMREKGGEKKEKGLRDGGRVRLRGEREEEEILQPCPLIVFSVVRGPNPALWECPVIPRDWRKENHPASVTHLHLHCCLPENFCSILTTQSQMATGASHSTISSYWPTPIPAVHSSAYDWCGQFPLSLLSYLSSTHDPFLLISVPPPTPQLTLCLFSNAPTS